MDKKTLGFIALLLTIFISLAFLQSKSEVEVDWTPTFNIESKSPYGLYIFDKELESLFPEKVKRVYETPFTHFDSTSKGASSNYLLVLPLNTEIDDPSAQKMLAKVRSGAKIFIAAQKFPSILCDSLAFESKFYRKSEYNLNTGQLTPASLERNYHFTTVDPSKTKILTSTKTDSLRVTGIEIVHGKGTFYLYANPYAFTNYHLLKSREKQNHVAYLMGYLNEKPVKWFTYYNFTENRINSPLRFIAENESLRVAWTLTWVSFVLMMIFRSRRIQRIIPELPKNRNTTVDFVRTIGLLYYSQKNHTDLVKKKIIYFFDRIKTDYFLQTDVLDEHFQRKLSRKSGKSEDEIKTLITLILDLNDDNKSITKNDLIELNNLLDTFFNRKTT
jgi:hypothetical protein